MTTIILIVAGVAVLWCVYTVLSSVDFWGWALGR